MALVSGEGWEHVIMRFLPYLNFGGKVCPRCPCRWVAQSGMAQTPPLCHWWGTDWEGDQEPLCARGVGGQVPSILTGAQDPHPPTGRFCDQIQSLLAEQAAGGEEVPSPTQPILEVRWRHGG